MKENMFKELLESVEEMDDIATGKKRPARVFKYSEKEVKQIREHTRLSQSGFAQALGVSQRTLENWEQGRRHPTGAALALLRVLEADPEHALKVLAGRMSTKDF